MATLDLVNFRKEFPAFADPVAYPDEMITLYWNVAESFITNADSPCNMLSGNKLQTTMDLLTAHLVFLFAIPAAPVAGGATNVGGQGGGFTTAASIGEVSVSKLAPPAKDGWQWWLAGSPYGQTLWALLGVLAVGGLSVGGLPERAGFRKVGGVFL